MQSNDSEAIAEQKEDWRSEAGVYWKKRTNEALEVKDRTRPPLYRQKAYKWLIATDAAMQAVTGLGYKHFMQPPDLKDRGPPNEWPLVVLSCDEGSDGIAATNYLLFGRSCGVIRLRDPSHRTWNNAVDALKESALYTWVLLIGVVMSQDHGPWANQRWYQTGKEAVSEYLTIADPDDEIFLEHYSAILDELGFSDRVDEPGLQKEVFKTLSDAFAVKVEKIASTRWFQVFERLEHKFLGIWYRRLVVLTYITIKLGFPMRDNVGIAAAAAAGPADPEDGGRANTRTEQAEVRRLQFACKNGLHFMCSALADRDLRRLVEAVTLIMKPVRRFYSEQSATMRSAVESRDWYIALSSGRGNALLADLAASLSDPNLPEVAGLWTQGPLPGGLAWPTVQSEHPWLCMQDKVAAHLGLLVECLLKQFSTSFAFHTRGWPAGFARLLDPLTRGQCVADMRRDYANFEALCGRTGVFWKKIKERHLLNIVGVRKVVRQL